MTLFPPPPQQESQRPALQAPSTPSALQSAAQPSQMAALEPLSHDAMLHAQHLTQRLRTALGTTLIGQEHLREALVSSLIAGGHLLIESVPGLAKTTAAQTLAHAVSGTFKRVQCTPDLIASDLTGMQMYDFATQQFHTQKGPIHANFVLLDEINRANAKTQSAMLEAMAERATTIGGERIALPNPFMVIATQNPIEEEGTFPLPEAQRDRFMMKTVITYPTQEQERHMLAMLIQRQSDTAAAPLSHEQQLSIEDVRFLQQSARRVHVAEAIIDYVTNLVRATRPADAAHQADDLATAAGAELRAQRDLQQVARFLRLGASPRGSIAFIRIAQAQALTQGRDYVIPEDVKYFAHDILRHRLLLTFDALTDGVDLDRVISALVETVPVP